MQSNLAFIIKELRNDSFSLSIIKMVSDFIEKRPLDNISLFTSFCDTIDTGTAPILHLSHASYFNADIIALDFESLMFSSTFTQKKKLIYYARTLPWSDKVYAYGELQKLFLPQYTNKVISIDSRIAEFYAKFFDQKEYVSSNLTYGDLYEKI